jgi:PAS domain S-box-containing protein
MRMSSAFSTIIVGLSIGRCGSFKPFRERTEIWGIEARPMSTHGSLLTRVFTRSSDDEFRLVPYVLRLGLVFVLYLLAGKAGLAVPFTSGNVSPVWPASGVAIAAVLLWGYGIWPGIALAAFLVNFLSPIPRLSAVGLGLGNAASALLGGYILRRLAGLEFSIARLRDVLGLIIAAIVSPSVAASVGVTVLFLTHVQPWSDFGSAWRVWWLGDVMGVLIVTPLFFAVRELADSIKGTQLIELLVLSFGLLATAFAIFGRTGLGVQDDVLAFAVFPFVIWAAIRFRVEGAAITTFLIAAIAIGSTVQGYGPFVKHNPLHNVILLQVFIAVTAVTGLILASVIAERKQTEERLLGQAQLLDLANDGIFVRTLDDRITYWNQGAERLYGWKREAVLGGRIDKILRTEFPKAFPEVEAELLREGSWQGELARFKRDGRRISVASRWSVWRNKEGKPLGFLELNTDITDRKRAEESMRALSGQLLKSQDDERRRIARELHDSAGQILVGLSMNLALIEAEAERLSGKASRACNESVELVEQMSQELRTLSHLLHPPLLDETGLPSAIRWYVEGFAERSKIAINLELSPELGRLSRDAETAIFRIVQECLTNIHRHSGSPTATIRITRDRQEIKLEVCDQGQGMHGRVHSGLSRSKTGVGIQGMRERIGLLGGRFDIHSTSDGTLVVAILPVTNPSVLTSDPGGLPS